MKIPGKVKFITVKPRDEELPAAIYALTDEGKIFVTYDDVPPEECVWSVLSLTLEDI